MTNIELWDTVVKKKKGVKYSMSKLRQLEHTVGVSHSLHCTTEEAQRRLDNSKNEYQLFKQEVKKECKTFLWDLAESVASSKGQSTTNVYKQMMHREEQQKAGRQMRFALGKMKKGGIKRLEITDDNDKIVKVLSKHGIEVTCLAENEKKYRQTESTPCMRNPLC